MSHFLSALRLTMLLTLLAGSTTGIFAQTGPGPAAEKNEITTGSADAPKSMFDEKAAARIWNVKPTKGETTDTMHKRVKRMLTDMVENSDKLDYDTSFWRLLAFVREVPWDKLSDSRKAWYLKNMPNPRLTDAQRQTWIETLKKKAHIQDDTKRGRRLPWLPAPG